MKLLKHFPLSVLFVLLACSSFSQIYHPDYVATIVFDGIDSAGPTESGVFGVDEPNELVDIMCDILETESGFTNPTRPDQVALASYYGDTYPSYYSQSDKNDVQNVTNVYGGGMPRYAMIMAKFCVRVMERSGAKQVNVAGVSMGSLVARWMIENDYEGLASSGKIARFVTIEGALCGNWACSQSDSITDLLEDDYDLETIDIQHMNYTWVEDNLHNPRTEMGESVYGNMIIVQWASTDPDMYSEALTIASGEPNDGICLYEDAYFHTYQPGTLYMNMPPTLSHAFATHQTIKEHMGIRAGLAAGMKSTKRVKITLVSAEVTDLPEPSFFDEGEVVFGCSVISPQANVRFGITEPVNRIDHLGRTIEPVEMDVDESVTVNKVLFNDFILPGETVLNLVFNVQEIDFDYVYDIVENPFDENQEIESGSIQVPVTTNGQYSHSTDEWGGQIKVEVYEYPAFITPSAQLCSWCFY